MRKTRLLDDEPGITPQGLLAGDDEVSAPTDDRVSQLAYSYWEARGFQGGSPWDDWFRAEDELKRRGDL